jgi:hypothetical protein
VRDILCALTLILHFRVWSLGSLLLDFTTLALNVPLALMHLFLKYLTLLRSRGTLFYRSSIQIFPL